MNLCGMHGGDLGMKRLKLTSVFRYSIMRHSWIGLLIIAFMVSSCADLSSDDAKDKLEEEGVPVSSEALIANIQTNDVEVVEWLLIAGVDADSQDDRNVPALIWAADLGYADIVELLIEHGARIDSRESGVSALMVASMEGHNRIVDKLIEAGANVNLQNQDGMTALMSAAFKGHDDIVTTLLEHGADPLLEMNNGYRAHQLASDRGHDDLALYIRDYGE